jgi:hypothetical protein
MFRNEKKKTHARRVLKTLNIIFKNKTFASDKGKAFNFSFRVSSLDNSLLIIKIVKHYVTPENRLMTKSIEFRHFSALVKLKISRDFKIALVKLEKG